MDDARFDRLVRTLVGVTTRRGTLAGLLGGALVALLPGADTEANKQRGKRRKKKKRKPCRGGTARCGKACVDTRVDPANCGGDNPGTPGVCGCTKAACTAGQCGNLPDGCGGTLDCGGCEYPEICGGGGTPNVCGCLANGEVTAVGQCDACCSKDCCFDGIPEQRVCAGGCG